MKEIRDELELHNHTCALFLLTEMENPTAAMHEVIEDLTAAIAAYETEHWPVPGC